MFRAKPLELEETLTMGARTALTEEQLRLLEGYGAVAAMALARSRKR